MPGSATKYEAVPVLSAWDETPSLRALRVGLGPLASSHAAPGQVVKLRAPSGEAYFALASAPSPDGSADLLLKRGGKIADEIALAAVPGARIETSAPFGKGFPIAQAEGRDLLLFAAGSEPPSRSARATSCTRPRTPGQASSASEGQRTTRTPCRSQSRCSPR